MCVTDVCAACRSGAAAAAAAAQHEFSVFWVPRRSIAVEKVLEDEGVYGSITQVRRLRALQGSAV